MYLSLGDFNINGREWPEQIVKMVTDFRPEYVDLL